MCISKEDIGTSIWASYKISIVQREVIDLETRFATILLMNEFDHRILGLLSKQEQERPDRYWGFKPRHLRRRCSSLPVKVSGQLGAGRYVSRL